MPVLSEFFGIKITMYYDDHNPPHFHAEYSDNKALIDINNARVLQGKLPSKQLKLVLAWTVIHQDELLNDWKLAMDLEELIKISPLQ